MRRIDLTGRQIGQWTVDSYAGDKMYNCTCSCGAVRVVKAQSLREGKTLSCGHKTKDYHGKQDLTGLVFGNWNVLGYAGKQYWTCECSCGTIKNIFGPSLTRYESLSCGHDTNSFNDITGMTFGEIYVLKYLGKKIYECECSCGKIFNVLGKNLRTGATKSCGHATNARKSIIGERVGHWLIKSYVNDKAVLQSAGLLGTSLNKSYVLCECECGRTSIVEANSIRSGLSTSCGRCNRTDEQIKITSTSENFHKALVFEMTRIGQKLSLADIARLTGLSENSVSRYISLYNAHQYVKHSNSISKFEKEVNDFIRNSLGLIIIQNDREILNGQELDLLIPDKNIAIECNGNYWHSEEYKPKYYHQQKTLQCEEKGIHLIHIFEHEWKDEQTQQKIKNLIEQTLRINQHKVYARNTIIKEINNSESSDFLNKYHLQNSINASTCLGLYYNNELVQVMTFGKSRFNSNYEIELLRFCTKPAYIIIGGASKLFKHYIKVYNPKSIVSYCDISKFTGKVYEQIGMEYDGFTSINYMYVDTHLHTLGRYACTKEKLIKQGYGTEEQSEEEIMSLRGYRRLYICGNKRYVYQSTSGKL